MQDTSDSTFSFVNEGFEVAGERRLPEAAPPFSRLSGFRMR